MNAKWTPVQLACLALAATGTLSADPNPGDSRAAVIAELGEPTARLAIGEREILMYPRGKVTLESERVTVAALKTKAEFEAEEKSRLEAEKQKKLEARLRAEALAERRRIGDEALAKLVDDPKWMSYSGDDRLEILKRLAKLHPDADLSLEMKLATAKRDREAAERRRIDDLEDRVAQAERRAAEAEERARRAETRAGAAESSAQEARNQAEESRRNTEVRIVETPIIIREQVITHHCEPQPKRPTPGGSTALTPVAPKPCPPRPAPTVIQPAPKPCLPQPIITTPTAAVVTRAPHSPAFRMNEKGELVPTSPRR